MRITVKVGTLVAMLSLFSAPAVYAMMDRDNKSGYDMMGHDSAWCAENVHRFGFMAPGMSWVNLKNVNSDLTAAGLSSFREYTGTGSIGMQKEYGKLIMESSLNALFWKDRLDSTLRTSVWMGNLMWNTGFDVLPSDMSVNLFPYAGIGVGLNTISVRSNEKSFSGILASTEPSSMFWQAAFLITVGLGTDFKLTNRDNTKGLVVGLRGGYLFDLFNKSRWRSDGVIVTGLSSMNQSGAYLRLVLGGWKHKM